MKTKDLGYIALSAALLTVSAWIAVPIGTIPITLQTATLFLVAGLLGLKRAVLATLAYILLGGIGVPVFAGFLGGFSVLLSPTGGYIVGFLAISLIVGWYTEKKRGEKAWGLAMAMFFALLLCYAFGTVWFMAVLGTDTGFFGAIAFCVLPYLPFDILKLILSLFLLQKLKKIIKTA